MRAFIKQKENTCLKDKTNERGSKWWQCKIRERALKTENCNTNKNLGNKEITIEGQKQHVTGIKNMAIEFRPLWNGLQYF